MDLVGLLFAGLLIFIIATFFIKGHEVIILVSVVILIVWTFSALILSKLVKFTLNPGGQFCYYQKGKLKYDIDLSGFYISYKEKRSGLFLTDLDLYIYSDENEYEIDCSGLGGNLFYQMFSDMKQYAMIYEKRIN